jgi:glutamine synthetase
MTPKQVLQLVKTKKIEFVSCRFMDFPGLWQHITFPASELKESSFAAGFGFDGSSIRGWEALNEQDMLIVPVAETAHIDPFPQHATLAMICDVKDPVTKKLYSRDPRSIGRKASEYIKKAGIADKVMFGPEVEFFVFDSVHYGQEVNRASYCVDSVEGSWNSGKPDPTNMGYQVRRNEGYFPCPPMDSLADLRSQMCKVLADMGVGVEGHHHEVATGGQCEIDLEHADLLRMADICMMLKHVVKNVAAQHGKTATFMPKPLFMDNGSGMHTHFSMWKAGKPLFPGNHYAGMSRVGLYAIGGLLRHAKSLLAFTNPTTNSYKRLVPGYEAPVKLVYSSRNRAAAIRIPTYSADPKVKRLEFRCPDSSCNPYLAFAAMTMAAADGIKNKIDPGNPLDKLFHELEPHELETIDAAPADLEQALSALENDHDYLLEGNVFTKEVIRFWIKYKRENEVDELRHRPHPHEFSMYFDI